MRNSKGFTVIEALIAGIIGFIVLLFVFTLFLSIRNLADGGNYCDMYRYSSLQDVPASCANYFLNGNGSQR